jgi:hypothetical protein
MDKIRMKNNYVNFYMIAKDIIKIKDKEWE